VAHLSLQLHRLLDAVLWLLWLPPVVCLLALVRTKGTAVHVAGLAFAALAEGAWFFFSTPLPGTWETKVHLTPGDVRETALPRPHTHWAGIDLRVDSSDGANARPWDIRIQFASGRVVALGPGDVAHGSMRVDCQEQGAIVRASGPSDLTLVAFEDNQTWKDLRVAWLLRQRARPWLAWGGAVLAAVLVGHALMWRDSPRA
jgi:hypothetical protein